MNEYERLKKIGWMGFVELYLNRWERESKPDDEIDEELYSKLVELDTRLGITESEQLFWSVALTQNLEIIKV